jgi:pantoate--beta-alanine ligase
MKILQGIRELREILDGVDSEHRVGLVPTMGNLHAGHVRLTAASVDRCDLTVATIFVNPLQFGPKEDLESYPRTLADDRAKLEEAGVDLLFAPSETELYPDGRAAQTAVSVPGISMQLCGASRPGHFDGVTTVVLKLFNIVRPDIAFFGRKDYQQLTIIRNMTRHLNVPVEIVGVDTVRADDGLALSSRNRYLDDAQRNLAPQLFATLQATATALQTGENDLPRLERVALQRLEAAGFEPDYIAIRDALTLAEPDRQARSLVILGAARLGQTRLIDNLLVERIECLERT